MPVRWRRRPELDTFSYLVSFTRVVQSGSFSAASERLRMAPSVVSKHVSKLEARLGVRLLNRSTRKLSLTEAGAAYYAHCLRILQAWEESKRVVTHLQAEPAGRLRVSALASFSNAALAPMLPAFFRRCPKVELEIVCSDRSVDLAEDGFDLALRVTDRPADHLVARKLADIRFQVCASPAYLERHGSPRTPADLTRHRCLAYPQTLAAGAWRFTLEGERGTTEAPVHSVFQANSVETLRALVIAGEGLALLPSYAIGEELRSGRMVLPMPAYRGLNEAALFAVYLPDRYGSPARRAFVDFLVERIGPTPPWDAPPPPP